MLILRQVTRRQLVCAKNAFYPATRCLAAQAKTQKDLMVDFKQSLPAAQPKKPKREPFAKNLFLGKIDYEFLTYPEPQQVDRYNEFEKWMKPIRSYMKTIDPKEFENTDNIPPHVLQKFRELRLFSARIHEDYGGINLMNSEFLRILEIISSVPALGLFFLKQGVPPIDIFNKYGTVEQKLKYLPKIATGQYLATTAVTENDSGPGVESLQTLGVLSNCNKYWIINGTKTFVSNANLANVFIVFGHAQLSGDIQKRPETISAFIIDTDTEGVSISQEFVKTVGLKGFNTGKLILKDVKIPKENLLGNIGDGSTQLVDLFSTGRHFIAAIAIAILKNFLDILIKNILPRKHFDKMLYETDAAQHVISNVTYAIYTIESVLYLTTSMMDIYDNQDMQLETALVEQYCVQECLRAIQDNMWIIGPGACTLVQPFEQILRDAFTITNYETSLIDTKIYSALLGLQHFGIKMSGKIKKDRNPFMYPKHVMKNLFFNNDYLDLHLDEYLHPSLKECADFCDRIIFKLKESSKTLLLLNGTNVGQQHQLLQRLSDIAALIYTYIAVMGRSSRSYCIGNRDSESEIKSAIVLAFRFEQKVNMLAEEIKVSEYVNGDYLSNEIANLNFANKTYFASHPLQRNYN